MLSIICGLPPNASAQRDAAVQRSKLPGARKVIYFKRQWL